MADKEYIERGALVEAWERERAEATDLFDAFDFALESVPAADVVEVRHGTWIIKRDEYDCEYMMCSCCKEEFYPADADTVDEVPKYCPNCGAKMDGERKETT